jgi:hypothetical protein
MRQILNVLAPRPPALESLGLSEAMARAGGGVRIADKIPGIDASSCRETQDPGSQESDEIDPKRGNHLATSRR